MFPLRSTQGGRLHIRLISDLGSIAVMTAVVVSAPLMRAIFSGEATVLDAVQLLKALAADAAVAVAWVEACKLGRIRCHGHGGKSKRKQGDHSRGHGLSCRGVWTMWPCCVLMMVQES